MYVLWTLDVQELSTTASTSINGVGAISILGGIYVEEKQKKQPAKRIQLVDVVLERKGSQLFSGRRVHSPEDAANIIRDFIGDSDREKFVVLGLSTKKATAVASCSHRFY